MHILAFVVSFAIFIVGIFLFGHAFEVTEFNGIWFFAGIVAVSVGVALPIHVLKRIDG